MSSRAPPPSVVPYSAASLIQHYGSPSRALPPGWSSRFSEEFQCPCFYHDDYAPQGQWVRPSPIEIPWFRRYVHEHQCFLYYHEQLAPRGQWNPPGNAIPWTVDTPSSLPLSNPNYVAPLRPPPAEIPVPYIDYDEDLAPPSEVRSPASLKFWREVAVSVVADAVLMVETKQWLDFKHRSNPFRCLTDPERCKYFYPTVKVGSLVQADPGVGFHLEARVLIAAPPLYYVSIFGCGVPVWITAESLLPTASHQSDLMREVQSDLKTDTSAYRHKLRVLAIPRLPLPFD